MQLETTISVISGISRVNIRLPDRGALTPADIEVFKTRGQPGVEFGGLFPTAEEESSVPDTLTGVTFTLPALYRTIPDGLPVTGVFSPTSTDAADVEEYNKRAQLFEFLCRQRIAAAVVAARIAPSIVTGTTVTTI